MELRDDLPNVRLKRVLCPECGKHLCPRCGLEMDSSEHTRCPQCDAPFAATQPIHEINWHYGIVTCKCGWAWDVRDEVFPTGMDSERGVRLFLAHVCAALSPPRVAAGA